MDRRHPWNQHTIPAPQKRDFDDKYSWTMSPRWYDGKDHLALDTGGGPLARLWATALAGLVDIEFVKATGHSVQINLPRTILKPEVSFEWKIPVDKAGKPLSNAIERNRARTYFQAYAAGCALHFIEKALAEVRAGHTKTWEKFVVPDESISVGFTEAVRGVLSHHMVIRGGKIANYHPYPPTPWNGSVRDSFGTPGPYEDAVQNTPIFEEIPRRRLQGHRHHARGAQLRSLPAVRCAHVQGRRETVAPHDISVDAEHDLSMASSDLDPPRLAERIEQLLEGITADGGPGVGYAAEELVTVLMRFYGAGLEQMVAIAKAGGGDTLVHRMAADPLVAGLLALHDLHPVPLAERLEHALDVARRKLGSHGGGIRLGSVDAGGRVHIELSAAAAGWTR